MTFSFTKVLKVTCHSKHPGNTHTNNREENKRQLPRYLQSQSVLSKDLFVTINNPNIFYKITIFGNRWTYSSLVHRRERLRLALDTIP